MLPAIILLPTVLSCTYFSTDPPSSAAYGSYFSPVDLPDLPLLVNYDSVTVQLGDLKLAWVPSRNSIVILASEVRHRSPSLPQPTTAPTPHSSGEGTRSYPQEDSAPTGKLVDECPLIIIELQRENAEMKLRQEIMEKKLNWLMDFYSAPLDRELDQGSLLQAVMTPVWPGSSKRGALGDTLGL